MTHALPVLNEKSVVAFRPDPRQTPAQRLKTFLTPYGLTGDLPLDDDGMVDLVWVVDNLPAKTDAGVNSPREHLLNYVRAMPPVLQMRGIPLNPDHVVTLLVERAEYFEDLSFRLTRPCLGGPKPAIDENGEVINSPADGRPLMEMGCQQYRVCSYAKTNPAIAGARAEDNFPCSYERATIQRQVKAWITDPVAAGGPPIVDPTRPEITQLFENAILLLVLQDRYRLELAGSDLRVPKADKIAVGNGMEAVVNIGEIENPLMATLIRLALEYQKVIKAMGLEPNDMKKRGEWISATEQEDLRDAVNHEAASQIMIRARRVAEGIEGLTAEINQLTARRDAGEPGLDAQITEMQTGLHQAEGALMILQQSEAALRVQGKPEVEVHGISVGTQPD